MFYRGGATVCPLYVYKDETDLTLFPSQSELKTPNIDEKINIKIREVFGREVSPEEIIFYVYAILYSPLYRNMYSEFLKTDFPRIPFTYDPEVFEEMARLGERLKDCLLYTSPSPRDRTRSRMPSSA